MKAQGPLFSREDVRSALQARGNASKLPKALRTSHGEKPDPGKDWGPEDKGQQTVRGVDASMGTRLRKLRQMAKDREARRAADRAVTESQTRLSVWTARTSHF